MMMMMRRSRSRLLVHHHRKEGLVVTWQRLFDRNCHCSSSSRSSSNDSSRTSSPMGYNAKSEQELFRPTPQPSTWQCNKMEKETAQFKNGLKVFQKLHEQHPQDIENLKKYADYIIKMVPKCIPRNSYEALTYRLEAKDILDAVLEIDTKDYQSWFNLGNLCDDILQCSKYLRTCGISGASVRPLNDNYLQIHEKAIYCFKRVNDEAPPGQFDSERMLNKMLHLLPNETIRRIVNGEIRLDEIEEKEIEKDEDELLEDETEFRVALGHCRIKEAVCDAEKESKINPNNADNMRKWGTALVGVAFHTNRLAEKWELISDAMKKFRKALKLKPEDKKTELELARARALVTGRSVEDFEGSGKGNLVGREMTKSYFVRFYGFMRQFTDQVWPSVKQDTEEDEMEKLDTTAIYKFEESAYNAAKENEIDPNNADNLRRWGAALVGLAFYSKHPAEQWENISDAIINLRKALKLNPEDEIAKLELARARFFIIGRFAEEVP